MEEANSIKLPVEIIAQIFAELPPTFIANNVCCLSKQWNAISSTQVLWRPYLIRRYTYTAVANEGLLELAKDFPQELQWIRARSIVKLRNSFNTIIPRDGGPVDSQVMARVIESWCSLGGQRLLLEHAPLDQILRTKIVYFCSFQSTKPTTEKIQQELAQVAAACRVIYKCSPAALTLTRCFAHTKSGQQCLRKASSANGQTCYQHTVFSKALRNLKI